MMPAFRSRFQGLASSPTVKPPCFDQWLTLDLSNLCGQVGRANDLKRLTPVKLGISRALSAVCPRNLFGARSLILSSTALTPCRAGSDLLGSQASPVAKSNLREFIAGVIASRKTGDQQRSMTD